MIMTSKYPVYKLFAAGSGVLTKTAGQTSKTITIAHNLGYIPVCFVYGWIIDELGYPTLDYNEAYYPFSLCDTPGLDVYDLYRFYADNTNLYIIYITGAWIGSQVNLPYIYSIFYDNESDVTV